MQAIQTMELVKQYRSQTAVDKLQLDIQQGELFSLLGVTVGTYVGSFLLGKKKGLSVGIPAVVGAVTTLAMYIGEMCLLSGNLYLLGRGFWFQSIPGIVLAPVDVLIILSAGMISGGIFLLLNKGKRR